MIRAGADIGLVVDRTVGVNRAAGIAGIGIVLIQPASAVYIKVRFGMQKLTPPRENKRTPRDPMYCAEARKLAGSS